MFPSQGPQCLVTGEVKMEREVNSCLTLSVAQGGGGRLVREGPGRELYRKGS